MALEDAEDLPIGPGGMHVIRAIVQGRHRQTALHQVNRDLLEQSARAIFVVEV